MSLVLYSGVFAGLAAGVDLFLTFALLSVLALSGMAQLPTGVSDLGSPWFLAPTAALFVTEAMLERRRDADLLWRHVALVVRPVGAAALGALIVAGQGSDVAVRVALLAGGIACLVHVTRSGWAFLARIGAKAPSLERGLVLEDAFVVALVAAWWLWPTGFWSLVLVAAVSVAARGWALIPAFLLSSRLVRAGVRSLIRTPGWSNPLHFPGWMKTELAPTGIVTGGRLRGTPAACIGSPRPGSVSRGWLVVRGRAPTFVRPTRRGVDSIELQPDSGTRSYDASLCYCVRISGPQARPLWIIVPRDGPDPRKLAFELR